MSSCLFEAKVEEGRVTLLLPIKTVSEANLKKTEHWTKSSKRHRQQQQRVRLFMNAYCELIKLPVKITITRIAPRKLDFDNLVVSQKWVLDAVCDQLVPGLRPGRADGDPRISPVTYLQETGAPKFYATKLVFEF